MIWFVVGMKNKWCFKQGHLAGRVSNTVQKNEKSLNPLSLCRFCRALKDRCPKWQYRLWSFKVCNSKLFTSQDYSPISVVFIPKPNRAIWQYLPSICTQSVVMTSCQVPFPNSFWPIVSQLLAPRLCGLWAERIFYPWYSTVVAYWELSWERKHQKRNRNGNFYALKVQQLGIYLSF